MDALTQAIEAYYGKDYRYVKSDGDPIYQGSNPMADLLAERAISLIAENLPVAVHQGSNLEARSNMLLGNIYSALAFSNSGVSWIHAAAYPVAERAPRPHGEVVGLLLPYGMQYNVAVAPEKFARIAELLGEPAEGTREARAQRGIERIFRLLEVLGMPSRLSQIGITRDQIDEIVDNSLTIERLNRLNPRALVRDDLVRLLHQAL
jgi:alcohol dehydrogenase